MYLHASKNLTGFVASPSLMTLGFKFGVSAAIDLAHLADAPVVLAQFASNSAGKSFQLRTAAITLQSPQRRGDFVLAKLPKLR